MSGHNLLCQNHAKKHGYYVNILANNLSEQEALNFERTLTEYYVIKLKYSIQIDGYLNDNTPHKLCSYNFGGLGVTKYTNNDILAAWHNYDNISKAAESLGMKISRFSTRLKALGISEEEIKTKRYQSSTKSNSKPVYQYDLEGNFIKEYSSMAEAERVIGKQNISEAVRGKLNHIGGYQWRNYKADKIEPFNKPINGPKSVAQIDKDNDKIIRIFPTATEAAKFFNTDVSNLCKVCRGKQKTCKGYKWKYVSDLGKEQSE